MGLYRLNYMYGGGGKYRTTSSNINNSSNIKKGQGQGSGLDLLPLAWYLGNSPSSGLVRDAGSAPVILGYDFDSRWDGGGRVSTKW